jgi:TetR/AcrR family transcriptional regulator, cholesterol catabolism regulator
MKRKALQEEREEWRRREFRRRILQAAERVIVRKGYGAMTMDDVAREAQFSKATLYHYFRSKGGLLLEILAHFFEEIDQEVQKINRLRISAGEKLKKGILFYLRFTEEKENISRMLMVDRSFMEKMNIFVSPESKLTSEADRRFITNVRSKRKHILDGVSLTLEEGIASGEFRRMDVSAAVIYLESLLQGYSHVRFWPDSRCSAKEAAEIIQEFLVRGIGRKEGSLKGASR